MVLAVARRRLAGLPLVVVALAGCSSNAVQVATSRPPVANGSSTAVASVVRTSSEATVPSPSQPRPTPTRAATTPVAATSPTRTSAPPPGRTAFTVVLNPGHDGGDAAHAAEISRLVPEGYGRYKACDTTGTETNAG